MRRCSHIVLALLLASLWTFIASRCVVAAEESTLCQQATAGAERASGVPDQLLDAISRVESGRYDASQGSVRAWPWTINAEGQGHFYASKQEAVEAARQLRARGIQSMDVGCTQINLMYHPDAFASLDDAFDPGRNAAYAAHFLTELFHQAGSWPHAAAAYHSQTPELGTDYQRKVLEAWADPINAHPATTAAGRASPSHLADFHRQIASLSSPLASNPGGIFAVPSHPFGRSLNAPLGGFGHILRSGGGPLGISGRGLAAYRAMPVAIVVTRPPPARY
jgi:transglycosylase-like protein with SLT domain